MIAAPVPSRRCALCGGDLDGEGHEALVLERQVQGCGGPFWPAPPIPARICRRAPNPNSWALVSAEPPPVYGPSPLESIIGFERFTREATGWLNTFLGVWDDE